MRVTDDLAALIDSLDVSADAKALGTTAAQVRSSIREGIEAGFITLALDHNGHVTIRPTQPRVKP